MKNLFLFISCFIFGTQLLLGQQIVFDRKIQAGDLTLYPLRTDSNSYYYLPFPRLALDENGKPKFSFIRYITNKDLGTSENAEGGGIINGIVELKVTDEEIQKAESKLKSINPNGKIRGAISYKSGTMSIVSAFQRSESGKIVHPVLKSKNQLENLNIGVAEQANPGGTEQGDKPTPLEATSLIEPPKPIDPTDKISIVEVTNDFVGDMITNIAYSAQAPLLEGGKAAFSVLLNKLGATVLWEQFKMAVPAIILQFNFEFEGLKEPLPARVIANWDEIYNHAAFNADAAYKLWDFEVNAAYESLRKNRSIIIEYAGDENEKMFQNVIKPVYEMLKTEMFVSSSTQNIVQEPAKTQSAESDPAAKLKAEKDDWKKKEESAQTANDGLKKSKEEEEKKLKAAEETLRIANANFTKEKTRLDKECTEKSKALAAARQNPETDFSALIADSSNICGALNSIDQSKEANAVLEAEKAVKEQSGIFTSKSTEFDESSSKLDRVKSEKPTFSGSVKLTLKRSKKSGKFTFDLKKWTIASQSNPTVVSLGGLGRYKNDPSIFLTINTDDPVWKQRSIKFSLEGISSDQEFKDGLNSVNVRFRKKHENNEMSLQDIVIDKNTFVQKGNSFLIGYGNKGDKNLTKWLDYEYAVSWNYPGGIKIDEPYKLDRNPGVVLSSPYTKNEVTIEYNSDIVKSQNIKTLTVDFYYKIGTKEYIKKQSISMAAIDKNVPSKVVLFGLKDNFSYEYVATWEYKDGSKKNTDRINSSDLLLSLSPIME